ncbi:MAG: hypothetical protein ABI791_11215 [Acidobacteriota bacterium]
MNNEEKKHFSEQDLSEGELVDQEPLEEVESPAVRLAGYNQIPDFGDDTEGTLQETDGDKADDDSA